MKKYSRQLALALALALTTTLLSGCLSNKAPTPAPAPATPTPAPTAPTAPTTPDPKKPDVKIIRTSTGAGEKQPIVAAQHEVFKKMIEESTKGGYTVEIYHSGQIADDQRGVEMARQGTLEMVLTATAWAVGVIPELAIYDIPFLFPSEEVADKVNDGPMLQRLRDSSLKSNVILLGFAENGFRHLTNSKRVVDSVDDLKGIKIRVMDNPFHLKLWQLLGANPVAMARTEVFPALQQKVIDAQENPIPDFFSSGIHEVAKFISLTGHVYSPMAVMYSKKIYDGYTPEMQKIIQDATNAFIIEQRKQQRQISIDETAEMIKIGCTITEISPENRKGFIDASADLRNEVAKKVDPTFYADFLAEVEKNS